MPAFGKTSLSRLSTCHPDLQRLFNAVVEKTDCSIICGHRSENDQNEAFRLGNSQLRWPKSRHNTLPSQAVDVVPYPIDWNDTKRFQALAEVVKRKAKELGIKVVWGGDWKKFKDYPHWELG